METWHTSVAAMNTGAPRFFDASKSRPIARLIRSSRHINGRIAPKATWTRARISNNVSLNVRHCAKRPRVKGVTSSLKASPVSRKPPHRALLDHNLADQPLASLRDRFRQIL